MVRVIRTSELGRIDYGGDADADGWDYSGVPREYDYRGELPSIPIASTSRKITYHKPSSLEAPLPERIDDIGTPVDENPDW